MEVIIAHARDEAPPLSKFQPHAPADLERVILRCLAKRPEDRFQDVESLDLALAECAAAGRWTQSQAAQWWRDRAPASTATRPWQENDSDTQPAPPLLDVAA